MVVGSWGKPFSLFRFSQQFSLRGVGRSVKEGS